MKTIFALLFAGMILSAQTEIQSPVFTGVVDASGATSTKVIKMGLSSAIPATCSVGMLYWKTDATAGQNLFGCTSTNTWTLEGGAGGSSLPSDTGLGKQGLTSDGSGVSAWKPLYEHMTFPLGYCSGASATATFNAISGGPASACNDTSGTNNMYIAYTPTVGSTWSIFFRRTLPEKFKSGSTVTAYITYATASTSGNTTIDVDTVCSLAASPAYNTVAHGTAANSGSAFAATVMTIPSINMTGCTGGSGMTFRISVLAANVASINLYDVAAKFQVDTY